MDRVGWRKLEKRVKSYFSEKLDRDLSETECQVGPEQYHKFDLVSGSRDVVIECKSYTWTEGENFPQAKVSTANEALFFLSRVKADRKILVMQDDLNPAGQSLVDVYVERYDGLMDSTEVWRYIPQSDGEDIVEQVRDSGQVYTPKEIDSESTQSSEQVKSSSFSGKYAPLCEILSNTDTDTVEFTFGEINQLLGDSLPKSAYQYRAWWLGSSHSHSKDWDSIGWTVSSLDLSNEEVVFAEKIVE